jgi:threonine dehydrogenase-like Zn-dependent dehydrogenase
MRALVAIPGRHTLELIEAPFPPAPGPGEVRVRTREMGICGTD